MATKYEQALFDYDNDYYEEKLEEGLQFQDFVTKQLYQRGIVVIGYASQKYQNNCGENMLGAEIKRDGNFRDTKNLYIETAEKSDPRKLYYTDSGIFRKDNSWLFVIGDEKAIWIFSTKYLRKLYEQMNYRRVETATSRAFLMPLKDGDNYCIRKIGE